MFFYGISLEKRRKWENLKNRRFGSRKMTHRTNLTLTSLLLHHQKVEQFVQKPDLRNCHIWLSRSNMTSLTLRFSWSDVYEVLMWPKWKFKTFDACEKKYLANQSQNLKRMPCNFHAWGIHHKAPTQSLRAGPSESAGNRIFAYFKLGWTRYQLCSNSFIISTLSILTSFRFCQLCPIQYIWSAFFVLHHLMY